LVGLPHAEPAAERPAILGIDLYCSESTEALLAHVLPVSKIAHTTVAYETAALRNFDPANVADGSNRVGSPYR
jgi:hypothetical protein